MKDSSASYYQKSKENIKKKSCKRYQKLSGKGKSGKRGYGRELYKNLSETKEQRLVEYRKTYKI